MIGSVGKGAKSSAAPEEDGNPWIRELLDLARAAAGGMLFGIPLLYTMEVWWVGSTTEPLQSLAVLAVAFVIIVVLHRTSGFRREQEVSWVDAAMDAVEALAVGLVCVTLILLMLRELTMDTPVAEALGKITYEATPFAIGIGLAHAFLHRGRAEQDEGSGDKGDKGGPLRATLTDVGATVIGAVFVAFNIAPTDEIPMLAAAMGPGWQVALVATSLVVSYWIVFESGFSSQEKRRSQPGVLQRPVTETVVSYSLALVTSAVMLWFFQQFSPGEPLSARLGYVVVLGLPAAVGGAAGRLAA